MVITRDKLNKTKEKIVKQYIDEKILEEKVNGIVNDVSKKLNNKPRKGDINE